MGKDVVSSQDGARGNEVIDVAIVGAGISGIGMAIALRRHGWTSFELLEAAQDIGGTWRDNTYPGIAVDIPSSSYCFSFETGYPWSRTFAPGQDVQDYIRHCARKYEIGPHIRFGARVEQARFDPAGNTWVIRLAGGVCLSARFLVAATGLFTTPVMADIPGLDGFDGQIMHTARWDHGYDFDGRRVAVVGTGASSIQIVPALAARVSRLAVFQRTPIYIAPRLDRALQPAAALPGEMMRRLRRALSNVGIGALSFLAVNHGRYPLLTHAVQHLVRRWMMQQLRDPLTARDLIPDYDLGCKRPALSNAYLACFNDPRVTLVVDPISRITPDSIVCQSGTQHPVDAIVMATGFRTTENGNAPAFEVFGANGRELGDFWDKQRRQAYGGIAVLGFPNFFLTSGPYSGGLNWFEMLETHVGQILQCLEKAKAMRASRVEIDPKAYRACVDRTWKRSEDTVFKAGDCATARSYYIDRHGDASLPSPFSPAWRRRSARRSGAGDFRFTGTPS